MGCLKFFVNYSALEPMQGAQRENGKESAFRRACRLALLATLLHGPGALLFAQGILAGRREQGGRTEAGDPGYRAKESPKRFNRCLLLVVDALREDFILGEPPAQGFRMASPALWAASRESNEWEALTLKVEPPSSTHHRLRAMMTGTFPPPLEGGAVKEDSLLARMADEGMRVKFAGDDTWLSLFPNRSLYSEAHPLPSFVVHDLHTVDNGVLERIPDWLAHPEEWDFAVGHFLGVDHAGHTLDASSSEMESKLQQLDAALHGIMERIATDPALKGTLLVVLGDHGQTLRGDHGGGSDEETRSAIFAFAPSTLSGPIPPAPNATSTENGPFLHPKSDSQEASDVDLAPTFAFALSFPVPKAAIGALLPQLLRLGNAKEANLSRLLSINAQHAIASLRRSGFSDSSLEGLSAVTDPGASLRGVAQIARERWATFHFSSLIGGLAIASAPLTLLLLRSPPPLHPATVALAVRAAALQSNSFILAESRGACFLLATTLFCSSWLLGSRPGNQCLGWLVPVIALSHLPASFPGIASVLQPYAGLVLCFAALLNSGIPSRWLAVVATLPAGCHFLACDLHPHEASILFPRLAYAVTVILLVMVMSPWLRSVQARASVAAAGILAGSSVLLDRQGPLTLGTLHWLMHPTLSLWLSALPEKERFRGALTGGVAAHFAGLLGFFATGHWSAFDGLHFSKAFVGFSEYNFWAQGFTLMLNTFAPQLLAASLVPLISSTQAKGGDNGALVASAANGFALASSVGLLACMACAGIQRRHLMAWNVFAPKFFFEAISSALANALLLVILRSVRVLSREVPKRE